MWELGFFRLPFSFEWTRGKVMATIYWAGDSTVQYNDIRTYPQTGIGQVMHLYLKSEHKVSNHAKNGRSTKSFLEEGRFVPIKEQMQEGDFLFVQFGHNDEKENDPMRYTTPQGTFAENLRLFIREAREKQVTPVLITPLERRLFDEKDELIESAHMDYVQAMKQVGQEENVAVIDLWAKSRAAIQKAGFVETRKWFVHVPEGTYPAFPEGKTDNTHLQYRGAVAFAGLIAEGLKELGGAYAELLIGDEPAESYNPSNNLLKNADEP